MTSVTFTSSGSWQALAASVDCQAWGEGGNGQNGTKGVHHSDGTGGGGGAYGEETALALTVSTVYPFTIGTGGSSTNTVFAGNSVTVTVAFGKNGSVGGIGGAAGSSSIAFSGGTGDAVLIGGGAAGNTGNGATPLGNDGGGNGGNGTGQAGSAPGGAGAGGLGTATVADPGSAGAPGQITIIYTASVSGTATLAGIGTLTASGRSFNPNQPLVTPVAPGRAWRRRFGKKITPPGWRQLRTLTGTATLSGTGTLTPFGGVPAPEVVNQWAGGYGQGTTFTSITSALQSAVTPLNPATSVGGGSGIPTTGNWLFAVSSWTQDPAIASVHIGVGDDIHEWWREFPGSPSSALSRTAISYVPNIGTLSGIVPANVYVAPDMEIAAINVLVVEVSGLGPWDTVTGTNSAYAAAATALSLSLAAPGTAQFTIAGTGGDNISSGQAFLPSGWTGLVTQTQTNGANALADNILTAACLSSTTGSVSVSGSASVAENMSGFILGVRVNGTNPIPAGSNPNWPHVVFEAGFGSGVNTPDSEVTWTDISTRAWDYDETTGIQFQLGNLQATELTLEFDNNDGNFSPANISSPYYPNVTDGTPLRMRMAMGTIGGQVVNRWYVLQRNATQWGEAITESFRRYNPVNATDIWAALSANPPSFYRSEIYEDSPYAWWPCDDQPGNSGVLPTFLLNAAVGNTNVLDILLSPLGGVAQTIYTTNGIACGGTDTFPPPTLPVYATGVGSGWMPGDPPGSPASLGTGNPETATPGSAFWQASGQAGTSGSYGWFLSCHDAGFPALSGGITVEGWFSYPFNGSATAFLQFNSNNYGPVAEQPICPLTLIELATSSAPVAVLQLDNSGHLNLITYNGTTGTSHVIYNGSDLRSGSPFMVSMTLTTTSWTIYVNGGATAQVSGTATGMTSAWTYFIANADMGTGGGGSTAGIEHGGNVSVAHLAVYPYVLPYYRVMDHYWAGISGFGQLPAPTGTQVTWTPPGVLPNTTGGTFMNYTPDGSASGGYGAANGVAASALVASVAPGGITSGPSAWTAASAQENDVTHSINTEALWVGWTGVAPAFNVYTAATVGAEAEAAVVCGSGDSFTSGFGGSAHGKGVAQVSGGDGSAPPSGPSAIGDTVGQRIERLMRAGRCSSPNRCIDPASLLVQAPGTSASTSTQAGVNIEAIQQSDSGMLFVDNLNHLTYWQRPHLAAQYSSPVWQIGPTTIAGRIPYYREIQWIEDPQRVWNVITIAPVSPSGAELPLITPANATAVNASQIRYGAQPLQITSWLQSMAEMQNQADWLFSVFGQPQRRAQQVKIDAAAYPAAWPLVAGINIGDVVQLEDWIIGGGGNVYTYRVTELRRHISFGTPQEVIAAVWLTLDYEPTSYWS